MEPPEANGTTKVMSFSGKLSAMAEAANAHKAQAVAVVRIRLRANE